MLRFHPDPKLGLREIKVAGRYTRGDAGSFAGDECDFDLPASPRPSIWLFRDRRDLELRFLRDLSERDPDTFGISQTSGPVALLTFGRGRNIIRAAFVGTRQAEHICSEVTEVLRKDRVLAQRKTSSGYV